MPNQDPTTPPTLISLIPYLLPPKGQPGSILKRPTDLVAILVHAIHTGLEFKLVGGGDTSGEEEVRAAAAGSGSQSREDQEPEQRVNDQVEGADDDDDDDDTHSETATAVNDDQDDPSTTSSTHIPTQPPPHLITLSTQSRLPPTWQTTAEDSYTFHYTHLQSSLKFIVRVGRLGGRYVISGVIDDDRAGGDDGDETEGVRGWTGRLSDLIDLDARQGETEAGVGVLPWPREDVDGDQRQEGLIRAFRSEVRLKEFITKYKKEVVARLVPGLRVEGYQEESPIDRPTASSNASRSSQPHPSIHPTHPLRPSQPDHPNIPTNTPYNPSSIGSRDLDPLGAFRPPDRAGGMMVDFDHPLFDGRRGGGGAGMGGPGGMINPPGARWDPVGPGFPGGSGGGGGGGIGGPLGGGGNYPGSLGGRNMGEPDFDELLPPGLEGPDLRQPGGRGGGFGGGRGGRGGGMGGGFGGMGRGGGFGGGFGGGGFGGGGGGGMFM